MLKFFKNIFANKIKSKKKCPNCGSTNISEGYYARGWNNLCSQASGDKGIYCYQCEQLTIFTRDEEYLEHQPCWCSLNGKNGKLYVDKRGD